MFALPMDATDREIFTRHTGLAEPNPAGYSEAWPIVGRRGGKSANPDSETLNAIRPAMATVPGAVLIGASSPYAKRGVLYEAFREHYGRPGPVLVWKATTREMNPSFPERIVENALARDPAAG